MYVLCVSVVVAKILDSCYVRKCMLLMKSAEWLVNVVVGGMVETTATTKGLRRLSRTNGVVEAGMVELKSQRHDMRNL